MPRFYKYLVIVEYKKRLFIYTLFANNDNDLLKRLFAQFPNYKKLKRKKINFEKYYK